MTSPPASSWAQQVAVIRQTVTHDPLAKAAPVLVGGLVILQLFGVASPSSDYSDGFFIGLVLVALSRRPASSIRERRFWAGLWASVASWLVGTLIALLSSPSLGTQVATELALGFFYVAFVFAIEQHPHRADDGRTSVPGEDPTWPVFALFVAGLFLYFNFVPVWVHQSYEDAWLPTSLLYLTLDVYLTVHLLLLYREGESPQWRAIYALLAVRGERAL